MYPIYALIILLLVQVSTTSNAMLFKRIHPLVWMQLDTEVSEGVQNFGANIVFVSPCKYIMKLDIDALPRHLKLEANNPFQRAKEACERAFEIGIKEQISKMVEYYSKTTQQEEEELGRHMQKRQAMAIPAFAAGWYMNDLVTKVEKWWSGDTGVIPGSSMIAEHIRKMEERVNTTTLLTQAITKRLNLQSKLMTKLIQEVDQIAIVTPQLNTVLFHLLDEISNASEKLRILFIQIKRSKLDIIALTSLIKNDDFIQIVDAAPLRVAKDGDTLQLEFTGRIRSHSTKAYRVDHLRYYTNLAQKPKLVTYTGPRFLVYNRTADCIMGIDPPHDRYINTSCAIKKYKDTRLSQWSTDHELIVLPEKINSTLLRARREIYVYCIKNNITINEQTKPCPTYPFAVNYNVTLVTSDGLEYKPVPVEMKRYTGLLLSETDVHPVHFEHQSEILDENAALKAIEELKIENMKLTNENTLINLPQGNNLSYKTTIVALLILLSLQTTVIVGYTFYSKYYSRKQTTKIIKTVTDPQYAERIYERINMATTGS